MDKVRFGVIGAGMMGALHARIGSELPWAQLVAAADVDLTRAQKVAGPYGAQAYADYREMLEREKMDAVVIATPEKMHLDPVMAAAESGCHIFLEKPLASSLADADAIISVCEAQKVQLMVGYILRFDPCYAKIKEAVADGSLGKVLTLYARRNAPIGEARRLGGRTTVINYIQVHDTDQILWYQEGRQVTKVTAKAARGRVWDEYQVPDFCWTIAEFDDGSLAVVETGWGMPEKWADWKGPKGWGGFGDVVMHVIGTQGVTDLNFTPMNLYGTTNADGWMLPETRHWPVVNGRIGGAALLQLEHFFDCVLNGKQPLIDGREARRSLEVALAADLSIVEGREVRLPL